MPDALPLVRDLGLRDYGEVFAAMRAFTDARRPDTPDEIWFVQHPPVFTQGQAGRAEHVLVPGDIPVVQSDRGGQVTYHGPGQLVCYPLLDIDRLGLNVRAFVTLLEEAMIEALSRVAIAAYADPKAPGVYVDTARGRAKIGSLGLRVRKGRSYHGLSLNVDMDLSPFARVSPCGYAGLAMTQVVDLGGPGVAAMRTHLEQVLLRRLAAAATPEAHP